MGLFNIFSDPLSPRSNTIGIYSEMGLASKLFLNRITLNKKLEELRLRGIDIGFPYASDNRKIYNNLSAEAFAIIYPELCKKYWNDKGKDYKNIELNQKDLFEDIVEKSKEAKKIYNENKN